MTEPRDINGESEGMLFNLVVRSITLFILESDRVHSLVRPLWTSFEIVTPVEGTVGIPEVSLIQAEHK